MNDSGRTRDLPIHDREREDLELHVMMCGERYKTLLDSVDSTRSELRGELQKNRNWHKAIFTAIAIAVLLNVLKTVGVLT